MKVQVKYQDDDGRFCKRPGATAEQFLLIAHAVEQYGWGWFVQCLQRFALREASETMNHTDQEQWIERSKALREVSR